MNIRYSPKLPRHLALHNRTWLVWLLLAATVLLASPSIGRVNADVFSVEPDDPNIHYVGRWDTSVPGIYRGYWAGTSLTMGFTGTSAKLRLGDVAAPSRSNIYVSIDGGPFKLYPSALGLVNLTPQRLLPGEHTLTVVTRDIRDTIVFRGLLLDEGAETVAVPERDRWIEFVGDSITVGYKNPDVALDSYAWLTGEKLGVDHTQIAYTGICLTDGVSCNGLPPRGMSEQYFKLQPLDYADSPEWNFQGRQPDAVVVNIGTNDGRAQIDRNVFTQTYVRFLERLRQAHPDAELFVLRPLHGYMNKETQQAVELRQADGDTKLYVIDTAGWLSEGDYSDGLHPSVEGNRKMADRLSEALQNAWDE
ncbi:hypothetical protein B9G55_23620 [Saccharibacillus sp. O16]|nr:hypothetical protein B9G55_23620 [Saccharibacillus sp. O16]